MSDMHMFELLQLLSRQGWSQRSSASKVRVDPYKPGALKIVWHTTSSVWGGLRPTYLITLLRADELLNAGLTEIHHMQVRKYYEAVLALPPSELPKVVPGQPNSFYQLMMQPRRAASGSTDAVDMEEDVGPLLRIREVHVLNWIALPTDVVRLQSTWACARCRASRSAPWAANPPEACQKKHRRCCA